MLEASAWRAFRPSPQRHRLRCVYDYSEADLDELGWDRFVSGLWESIFAGYRGFTGIRTIGRRWSDLLQGGLGCSQELADELVRTEIIMMEGRTALASKDPMIALAAMDKVLADMGVDLAELPVIPQNERSRLLVQLGLWRTFLEQTGPAQADG